MHSIQFKVFLQQMKFFIIAKICLHLQSLYNLISMDRGEEWITGFQAMGKYAQKFNALLAQTEIIPIPPNQSGRIIQYSLIQDLSILVFMYNEEEKHKKYHPRDSLARQLGRTPGAISQRYSKYLAKLIDEDFRQIDEHIERHGIQGFLIFQEGVLVNICLQSTRKGMRKKYLSGYVEAPKPLVEEQENPRQRVIMPYTFIVNGHSIVYQPEDLHELFTSCSGNPQKFKSFLTLSLEERESLYWNEEQDNLLIELYRLDMIRPGDRNRATWQQRVNEIKNALRAKHKFQFTFTKRIQYLKQVGKMNEQA